MKALLFALLCTAGCKIEPCDPQQTKVWNASCFPDAPPAETGGSPGSGGSSSGGSNGEAGEASEGGSGGNR